VHLRDGDVPASTTERQPGQAQAGVRCANGIHDVLIPRSLRGGIRRGADRRVANY
jgi:hypothetical protein